MNQINIKIIQNIGSCKDTILNKTYSGQYLETGDLQPTTEFECDEPMIYFIDEVGDEVYTYVKSGLVAIEGEEE